MKKILKSFWWDSSWKMRSKLTFKDTALSGNQGNSQVLVHLTPDNFNFSQAKADGSDIRFINIDNLTELDYKIEKWTSKQSWVWVNIPHLKESTETNIWIYFGNKYAAQNERLALSVL